MVPIYKVPWVRSIPVGARGEIDLDSLIPEIDVIIFQAKSPILLNWDYPYVYNCPDPRTIPYRYQCLSCYKASGRQDVFCTQCEPLQRLKDGPTKQQQEQMQDHAQQHRIMWSWARSMK